MAHELEIIDNVAQMFSVKKTPWHKLGIILPDAPTAADAIVAAGLNWTVSKQQARFNRPNGTVAEMPGQFAVMRDSDMSYLGSAGDKWQPLQNVDAFRFFDPFIEAGEATYETAGSLDSGKRIWVLAKLKGDPIEIVKGDVIEKYILLSNAHRAGVAVSGALTPIRVVCANTEAMAMSDKRSQIFRATHSLKMNERLEQVQASIAEANSAFTHTAEFYKRFARTQVNQETVLKFLKFTFDWKDETSTRGATIQQQQGENILRLFESGRGSDIKGVKGTLWGLYNAVTEQVAHEGGKSEEARLKSCWYGPGMDLNQRAFKVAQQLMAA